MDKKEKLVQLEISRLENNYPDDDIINNYNDFLQHSSFLHLYSYNQKVFCSLIDVTYAVWYSKSNINRQLLIKVAKRYFLKDNNRKDIPENTATKIFELFKYIIGNKRNITDKDITDAVIRNIDSIFTGIKLTELQLRWLCVNANSSPLYLKRILKHEFRSKVVSRWALINYEKNIIRNYRFEVTSWLIDEDLLFKINKDTLVFDFEYLNSLDIKMMQEYENEFETLEALIQIMPAFTQKQTSNNKDFVYVDYNLNEPYYKGIKRFYKTPVFYDSKHYYEKIDIELLNEKFYLGFNAIYITSMVWSIALSRISIKDKINLLEKYYSNEHFQLFLNIGKELNSLEYYIWLNEIK